MEKNTPKVILDPEGEAFDRKIKAMAEEQKYRDSLPSPNVDFNRHQIKTALELWEQIAFIHYCIGQLVVDPSMETFERLKDEEDAMEGFSNLGRDFSTGSEFMTCIEQMADTIKFKKNELAEYLRIPPGDQRALDTMLDKLYTYLNAGTMVMAGVINIPLNK